MSIKFRAINEKDIDTMVNDNNQFIKFDAYLKSTDAILKSNNVTSKTLARGEHRGTNILNNMYLQLCDVRDLDEYMRVGVIKLGAPILNPFLAGRKKSIWSVVLGRTTEEINRILRAELLYDKELDSEISVNSIDSTVSYNKERYIFGASYLLKLLDDVDIFERFKQACIESYIVPALNKDERELYKEGELNCGEFFKVDQEMLPDEDRIGQNYQDVMKLYGYIFADYALNPDGSDISSESWDRIFKLKNRSIELKQYDKVSCLYNCLEHNGIETLKSQVMNYIFVMPYGYRPTIDNRIDKLTFLYNQLMIANVQLIEQNANVVDKPLRDCLAVYRNVVDLIEVIFVGNPITEKRYRLKNYKSISDTITGKEGLMRGRMQGVRIDYSGRTVISENPNMPIDTIGVPRKMMKVLAEPNVIRDLKAGKLDEVTGLNLSQAANKMNLSKFSQNKDSEICEMTYDDIFDEWMKLEDRYVVIGRQPTLFYLGMRAFKVKLVNTNTIVLSPLVVMPFNADFDGDQMHINMPVTERGMQEVLDKMTFKDNLFYPKNGALTIVMRHEIIYGLYMCSHIEPSGNAVSNSSFSEIYDCVCNEQIAIEDIISGIPAGKIALAYALYGSQASIEKASTLTDIKAGVINDKLSIAYNLNSTEYLDAINRLVRLGFCVSKIYPPNISTVIDPKIKEHVTELCDNFNIDINKRREFIEIGLEIEDELSTYFDDKYKVLNSDIKSYLAESLDEDNGYMQMYKSGSKGDMNNITQVFGFKGQVQRGNGTGFNSIVEGSYSGQLTGLEHFITAYGSRRGIVDKTLQTADHGYLSRKLEHAGSLVSIVADDCKTDKYLSFYISDIVPFLDEGVISDQGVFPINRSNEQFYKTNEYKLQCDAAIDYLKTILVGRRCFDSAKGELVNITNEKQAVDLIKQEWNIPADWFDTNFNYVYTDSDGELVYPGKMPVKMRSPIYCDSSCCGECYGRDIAKYGADAQRTHKKIFTDAPGIGRGVGFIAAQAIGEPGTQMTMKNFQKGGIVSEANLTSVFDLIEDYFELIDLSKHKGPRNDAMCDYISPAYANIVTQNLNNGTKLVKLIPVDLHKEAIAADLSEEDINELDIFNKDEIASWNRKKIIVDISTQLKTYVSRGESIQVHQGNLVINQILSISGYDAAAKYLTLRLYDLFKDQDVNFKHFEVITSAMTIYYAHKDLKLKNGNTIRAGSTFTKQLANQLVNYEDNIGFISKTLVGVKMLPKYKNDLLESILMENMDNYIPRAMFLSQYDSMTNPITRAAFGLNIGIGTDVENRGS